MNEEDYIIWKEGEYYVVIHKATNQMAHAPTKEEAMEGAIALHFLKEKMKVLIEKGLI